MTEYKKLYIFNEVYFVSHIYTKFPKNFSYKKVKTIYIEEIFQFIKQEIENLDFKVNYINIQYFNCGYSITDIIIGFDKIFNDDIHSMRVIKDMQFSDRNIDQILTMNTYIYEKMYFKSLKRMFEYIKQIVEEKYKIKVMLVEITD